MTDSISSNLLPCPFCGGTNLAAVEDAQGRHTVQCSTCLACGPRVTNVDDVAETDWNERATHETFPKLPEEAKTAIGRSLAELAVLHKDGKTYNIRRVAGQALEVINNLHLMIVRATKETTPKSENSDGR